jgi:hypothetical protein
MSFTKQQVDLEERYAWVDQGLEELYYRYALTAENCDEFQDAGLLIQKWAWVDKKLQQKEIKINKKLEMRHNIRIISKKENNQVLYKELEYDLIEKIESDEE